MNVGIVSTGDSGADRRLVLYPSQVGCTTAGPHQKTEDPDRAQTVYHRGRAGGQSGPLYPSRGKAGDVYLLVAICYSFMS